MSNKIIADVFLDIADAIESGEFGEKVRVGVTGFSSEHGLENIIEAGELAEASDLEVVIIGPKCDTHLEVVEAEDEESAHKIMEELLDSGELDACVTMHYTFPIGVSTVGRVVTPGKGKEMILATTTGTSAIDRVEANVRNAIYGQIVAKALGNPSPEIGILNVDAATNTRQTLNKLKENGYEMEYSTSIRDGGDVIMRGNDLLTGTPDVMVTDTLTGNLLMKVFSSYSTGGSYEAVGYGYGPGIGEGYDRNIFIVSRASGAPVIANAIRYAYDIVKGDVNKIIEEEFAAVEKAGFDDIIKELTAKKESAGPAEEVTAPPEEIVTESIEGIDILSLDEATQELWKHDIYAESGMGCTGPIVQINEKNVEKSKEILKEAGFID